MQIKLSLKTALPAGWGLQTMQIVSWCMNYACIISLISLNEYEYIRQILYLYSI